MITMKYFIFMAVLVTADVITNSSAAPTMAEPVAPVDTTVPSAINADGGGGGAAATDDGAAAAATDGVAAADAAADAAAPADAAAATADAAADDGVDAADDGADDDDGAVATADDDSDKFYDLAKEETLDAERMVGCPPAPFQPKGPCRKAAPAPPRPAPICRPRYLYHPEKADWEGARLLCEREGGQLAVITSEKAQGTIENRFTYQKEFWIGSNDLEREGQFRWVNGEPMGLSRWQWNQPKKSYPNNQHCVTFNYRPLPTSKRGRWADRNCFESLPFLCETMICQPAINRYPSGYPGRFQGPLNRPYIFPRNQNFPGPRSWRGIATRNLPYGRGFPYNRHPQFRPAYGRRK